jgi:hypothetical protein
MFREVFEPWESNPWMLEAYHRARGGPGGERLQLHSAEAIVPIARAVLQNIDQAYMDDISAILTSVAHGVIARFVAGELDITELLPTLERTVFRLTTNNVALANRARRARTRRPDGR